MQSKFLEMEKPKCSHVNCFWKNIHICTKDRSFEIIRCPQQHQEAFFNSYFDISLQFYGYLSQQQNMMQDYVRTGTYQRAILQNHTDFKDKVTSQWSSVHDGVIWCDSNADSDNQLHRDVLKCPTSKEKLKTSLDRWRRLKKKKSESKEQLIMLLLCVCSCAHIRRRRKQKLRCVGGTFCSFHYQVTVCVLLLRHDGVFPPLLPVGGFGCRLWLRDPLLLCSPSWS